jgi:hypothetical protein
LQFDVDVPIDLDCLRVVLHSQRDRVVVHELVGQVPLDQAALPAPRIAHHNHLKHQVVLLCRCGHYYIKINVHKYHGDIGDKEMAFL